jgi:hypothetical protein
MISEGMTKFLELARQKGSPRRYRFARRLPMPLLAQPVLPRDSAFRADNQRGRVRITEIVWIKRAVGTSHGQSAGGNGADDQSESGKKRLHGFVLTVPESAALADLREARARAIFGV